MEPANGSLETGKQENGHVSEHGSLQIDLANRPTLLEAAAAPQSRIITQRWYVVMMFSFTTALLFADQNLLAPNLSEAARDFGFNDREKDLYLGGVVSIVFFLVGAPASIFIGYLMDKRDRRMLLWLCVVVGETPCMLTIFVREYWQLLLTRCLTGIAVGGATPLIYSILSDLYPPSERALITTLVVICTGAGTALGQMLAGFLPADWRVPFAIVAIVGVAVATVMVLTVRDPRRGAVEAALQASFEASEGFEYDEKITWSKFANIARIPTNSLIILQGIAGCLPWGMMMAFMTDYLIEDKGLSKGFASLVVVLFGAGAILGGIGGGTLGQWLYNWRKGYISFMTGASVWLGIPVLVWLVNGDIAGTTPAITVIVSFLGGAVASVAGVTLRPLIMNVNEPETRGMALSMHATLDDIGKGFGPAVVASLISGMGRPAAFNVSICGWIPCGIMLFATGFFLEGDEHAMQLRLLSAVQKYADPGTPDGVELTDVHKDSLQVMVESLDVQ